MVHGAFAQCEVTLREDGGGVGCRNCLERLVACISSCLRLAPTVPGGARIRSATAAGEGSRGVRHYQMCSLDGVQRVQLKS